MIDGITPERRGSQLVRCRAWRPSALFGALLVFAALLAASTASAQSTQIFLELIGQNGPISALSGTVTTGFTDHSEIHELGGNIYVESFVPAVLVQRPLRLVKDVDGASPRILEALTTFENITTCNIRYVAMGPTPTEFFRIELTVPTLAGLTAAAASGSADFPTEVLSIGYRSIQYVYTPLGP